MNNRIFKTITVLSFLLALTGASAQAQNGRMVADVPFKFVLNKKTLAAGKYEVNRMGESGRVLRISTAKGKNISLIIGRPAATEKSQHNPRLVFHRYGDNYFLAQIWTDGDTGYQLPKTRAEKEIAQVTKTTEPTLVSIDINQE